MGYLPGDPNSSDPEGKIEQPYHNEEPSGGFLILTVKSGIEKKPLARITFYDEKGIVLYKTEKIAANN